MNARQIVALSLLGIGAFLTIPHFATAQRPTEDLLTVSTQAVREAARLSGYPAQEAAFQMRDALLEERVGARARIALGASKPAEARVRECLERTPRCHPPQGLFVVDARPDQPHDTEVIEVTYWRGKPSGELFRQHLVIQFKKTGREWKVERILSHSMT